MNVRINQFNTLNFGKILKTNKNKPPLSSCVCEVFFDKRYAKGKRLTITTFHRRKAHFKKSKGLASDSNTASEFSVPAIIPSAEKK